MSRLHHPACVGALTIGICFNAMLGILGILGIPLVDAFYLTILILTIIGAAAVQMVLRRNRKAGD